MPNLLLFNALSIFKNKLELVGVIKRDKPDINDGWHAVSSIVNITGYNPTRKDRTIELLTITTNEQIEQ